ncbi:MAG: imidazolonepropionase [Clostridiales bacterium]|jgi:imidazolonepropionase|nr:imidazolonepropionase [Clostridiales bacterium]
MDLLLRNIGLLATPTGNTARKGDSQGQVTLIENAAVGIENGTFVYVGSSDESLKGGKVIDCECRLVTPGLVDAHTHLVFGGWRQKETARKLAGESYLDILKSGGGILDTVRHTRAATEAELYEKSAALLDIMLAHGTTTAECKSGYGLNVEDELKQLRVIKKLNKTGKVELAPTFMGAHAIPSEFTDNRDAYIDLICDETLPAVQSEGLADFCDVFCETAAFTPEESRRVLGKAVEYGLIPKAHVDEIDPIGGAEMAAEMGCISAEHLIRTGGAGIRALEKRGVVACLLPATSFCLGKGYARARDMIEAGVAVAICTDFNPGSSPNLNLQFPMYLAGLKYRLTPAEALTAVTLNGAAAIGRCNRAGSIEVGKQADLVIWDAPDLDYIFYRYGTNLVRRVIKKGEVIEINKYV